MARTNKTAKHDAHVKAQAAQIVPANDEAAAQQAAEDNPTMNAEQIAAVTQEPAPLVAATAPRFYLTEMVRPTGTGEMGKARMFAHTAAFLKVSGMLEGKPVPSLYANRALGATAMQHHKAKFTSTAAGLTLTPEGIEFFTKRPVNAEFEAAYTVALTTGKPDGAMVKNDKGIGEFKA